MRQANILIILGVLLIVLSTSSCKQQPVTAIPPWKAYDQSGMLQAVSEHENPRMRLKLIQSKVLDPDKIWDAIRDDIRDFGQPDYERLYPLIYEQDIPSIQASVSKGELSYEELTKWYLFRIVQLENDSTTTLHTIIALNPDAVERARNLDNSRSGNEHPVYGMPILLKDNINTKGMNTTAGALALKDNITPDDATIVKNLKEKGAIILGKVNLSEWAYYFCGGCPVGYSAIGGQTLNPYGRGIFETGGSSAGSGTSMAANYAVGAVGTETSGSILSPSGANSVVGLKPTIGLLSRTGIVPISGTLDTPGPMTRNVTDNAILLDAMTGADPKDPSTEGKDRSVDYLNNLAKETLEGKRLGVINNFLDRDTVYKETVRQLEELGATLIQYDPPDVDLNGFSTLLSAEMKRDLPIYIEQTASPDISVKSVADVIAFNLEDTLIRAPYGQVRLEGSASDTTSVTALMALWERLNNEGRRYFDEPMTAHNLDAILSIDNFSAGYAAVAHYPCLTVPMGFEEDGSPTNLTFIGPSESENKLLQIGYAFEQATKARKPPKGY